MSGLHASGHLSQQLTHPPHGHGHSVALLQHPVLNFVRVCFGILDNGLSGCSGVLQDLLPFLLSLPADGFSVALGLLDQLTAAGLSIGQQPGNGVLPLQ